MQIIVDPRQTGKTTAVIQALAQLKIEQHFANNWNGKFRAGRVFVG